jgi:hypothetical protein
MAGLIPSRLITLRRYARRGIAEADRDRLNQAGIAAYVKGGFLRDSGRSLMVGEEYAAEALEILGEPDPDTVENFSTDGAFQCPRCGSRDITPRPPYAVWTMAAGIALTLGVLVYGRAEAAAPMMGAAILISTVVFAKSSRWRCRACQLVYGRPGRPTPRT